MIRSNNDPKLVGNTCRHGVNSEWKPEYQMNVDLIWMSQVSAWQTDTTNFEDQFSSFVWATEGVMSIQMHSHRVYKLRRSQTKQVKV